MVTSTARKGLDEIQREIAEWAREQFGDNPNRSEGHPGFGSPLGSIPPELGMNEEIGEIALAAGGRHDEHITALVTAMRAINHAYVYRLQGRGDFGNKELYLAEVSDGLADWMVFACDFCNRLSAETGVEVNLIDVLNRTWEKVSQRRRKTWNADKATEAEIEERLRNYPPGTGITSDGTIITNIQPAGATPEVSDLTPVPRRTQAEKNAAYAQAYGAAPASTAEVHPSADRGDRPY